MDHHKDPFDEGTLEKLSLYRDYLRAWLPVFLPAEKAWTERIQLMDFFAGPGLDINNIAGSPLIALEELNPYWETAERNCVRISLFLNEFSKEKYKSLLSVTEPASKEHTVLDLEIENLDFSHAFEKWAPLMGAKNTATLVFLDQNGVKQITPSVFKQIINSRVTDFLFFISSSYLWRFNESDDFRRHLNIPSEVLKKRPYAEVHRAVFDYYKGLIPDGHEYYMAPFSIKKGANIYGLIFGTHHVKGIEKFLLSAWKKGGDANFDIDGDKIDPARPSLFPEDNIPKKLQVFDRDLRREITEGRLRTNVDVYLFALESGCLPKHARSTIKKMQKEKVIHNSTLHISYDAWKIRATKLEKIELV